MKTISMTLDENIIKAVDETAEMMGFTRSSFIQYALQLAFRRYNIKVLEEKHRQGYLKNPVKPGEFDVWEDEQVWTDEYEEAK
jgi:metal-responsive CopG/Arc/MetJ family transcriptional regulator